MAKTEEELEELKKKIEDLKEELDSLSDEELDMVTGGFNGECDKYPGTCRSLGV